MQLAKGNSMAVSALLQLGALLVVCGYLLHIAGAQTSQEGFRNIDCGSETSYTDPVTGIQWEPDTSYISTGFNAATTSTSSSLTDRYSELKTFRYFNDSRPKNCYTLPVTKNKTYLLRASFFYGNSPLWPQPPQFRISLDTTIVANITTDTASWGYWETTLKPQGNVTFFCLLRGASQSVPLISAISLRPGNIFSTYFDKHLVDNKHIQTRHRLNFGGADFVRFPVDAYDRYWSPQGAKSAYLNSTTTPIEVLSAAKINMTSYRTLVPEAVLRTAVSTKGNLTIDKLVANAVPNSILILHFAELNNRTSNVSRKYSVSVPSYPGAFYVNSVNFTRERFKPNFWIFPNVSFSGASDRVVFFPKARSRLGPLVNALELFTVRDFDGFTTAEQHVVAIEAVKANMNMTEWTGDPCRPVPHAWLVCTTPMLSALQLRVEQVNLSGYNLKGSISSDFNLLDGLTTLSLDNNALTGALPNLSSMTTLQKLHLHDNQLSGSLPDWLSSMTNLTKMSIQHNNFSGIIPAQLLTRNSLNFTYRPGNPLLMESNFTNVGTKSVVNFVYMFVILTILTILNL